MKNILITGAFGYVGGRVSKFLAESKKYQLFLTSRKNRVLPDWAENSQLVIYSLEEKDSDKPVDWAQVEDAAFEMAMLGMPVSQGEAVALIQPYRFFEFVAGLHEKFLTAAGSRKLERGAQ